MNGDHDNQGARIRAARAYAKMDQGTLAERVGIGREVVIATEADKREPTVPELRKIAKATGVPFAFLTDGWQPPEALEQRVTALEQAFRMAQKDRDRQAQEIGRIYETLETRFAEIAAQRLAQAQPPKNAADRRRGADRRAP